jgi:hypothetical protein
MSDPLFFLIDAYPKFCPGCGREHGPTKFGREDFTAGAAMICPDCNAQWQHLSTARIKDASRLEGGDLARYMDQDGW